MKWLKTLFGNPSDDTQTNALHLWKTYPDLYPSYAAALRAVDVMNSGTGYTLRRTLR